jgi:hydrogenase expression/formation protein HypC
MCLAIPALVVALDDDTATIEIDGVRKEISAILLEDLTVGDYVVVHTGFAISRIDPEEAERTLALLRQAALAAPVSTP